MITDAAESAGSRQAHGQRCRSTGAETRCGLKHAARAADGRRKCCRVGSARDAVKRGQQVWVKVLSITGQRLSLSMRDVDQETGKVRGSFQLF